MIKKFLITSGILLLLALICAIFLFVYLGGFSARTSVEDASKSTTAPSADINGGIDTSVQATPEQRSRLEEAGINPNIEITDERVQCAITVLGTERAQEIAEGAEPTLVEMGKLLRCI